MIFRLIGVATACCLYASTIFAGDLAEIRKRGVLRHLGVPYAHFVRSTDKGLDGLDAEGMQRFAQHLGVEYQWVVTSWSGVIGDLTGQGRYRMPGMDGLTLLKWSRKVHPELPVIIMSGHGVEDSRDEALGSGAFAFLTKPFSLQDVKRLITEIQERLK